MSACLSVCNTMTFESLDVGSSLFGLRIRVKFVYEGHRVKVKVTGAKQREILHSRNVKLIPVL